MATELSAENFKGEEKMIEIESLVIDKSFQMRVDLELFKKMIADTAEAVREGKPMEPVLVIELTEDGKTYEGKKLSKGDRILCDGFRRTAGHLAADRSKIPALVRLGTVKDAYDVAASANISNLSLPRTKEDKRNAVRISLFNHFDYSDNWHSKHCQVGHELPSKLRPEVAKLLPKELVEKAATERKTAGGKSKKQAAKKKKKAKPEGAESKKLVDWAAWEDHVKWLQKFLDHVAELEGKCAAYNQAMGGLEKHRDKAYEWKEQIKTAHAEAAKLKKESEDAAKKAAAEAKKAEKESTTAA